MATPGAAPFILALALLGPIGCRHLAPSKPLSQLTPQEMAGHQVFAVECARCHYADSERGMYGPGLEALFRTQYLPGGETATDANVADVILHGHGMMPALGSQIDAQELQDLMAYLHTL